MRWSISQSIKNYVAKKFPEFGRNKQQEISRLLYEIAKRENVSFRQILSVISSHISFANFKHHLLKRRYPTAIFDKPFLPYLPALDINPKNKAIRRELKISPKNIFIEESVAKSCLANRMKTRFPNAKVSLIPSLTEFTQLHKFNLSDYNQRGENFFIIKERFDFFKKCPCTQKAVLCHYEILNLGYGCLYECSYCYLQEYTNTPGIIFPANIDDFFKKFNKYHHTARIGTGEFTDSLLFDDLTEFSVQLIEFFRKYPSYTLELKTKSKNIANILRLKPCKNVVVAWSLNPQRIIDADELYTPSLRERLQAAHLCVEAGFRVAFHFDPIIPGQDWGKDYQNVINELFDRIPEDKIAWISLGTLRFTRQLKKIIENRFPQTNILDGELFLGFDKKMRYPEELRFGVYKEMIKWIKKRSKKVFVYLCMENIAIWNKLLP